MTANEYLALLDAGKPVPMRSEFFLLTRSEIRKLAGEEQIAWAEDIVRRIADLPKG